MQKSLLSMLSGMHWNEQVRFAEALETIKTAAAMLSRPEVVACMAFLKETAHTAGMLQATMHGAMSQESQTYTSSEDAMSASVLYETINKVSLEDAVKTIAAQDSAIATALQYAIKAVALQAAARSEKLTEEDIRAIVSEEAGQAVAMLRSAASTGSHGTERRMQPDRRKHH